MMSRASSKLAGSAWRFSACWWALFSSVWLLGTGPARSASGEDEAEGRRLVAATCQSCHAMPDPSALDRTTWIRETLKSMAPWLGVSRPNLERLPDGKLLAAARLFPDEPVFSLEEWRRVTAYFASNSPALALPQPPRPAIESGIPGFDIERWTVGTNLPFSTLIRIDANRRLVWLGDGQDRSLRAVGGNGKVRWRLPVPSGPVDLADGGDHLLVTLIGRVFPSDELAGQLWRVPVFGASSDVVRVLEGLRRPVGTVVADLDKDGLGDLVVSAFGNRLGNLSWYRGRPGGVYTEEVLQEYPGTLRTVPIDWNRDGRTDLLVLRAQAREGLSILLDDGAGGFHPKTLLEWPPTHGAVDFQFADLDRDGVDEIIVVNGDSGDYPSPHKAYHGLRIYARVSEDLLVEKYFFPMHGAYGARAADFDADGDQDLALISFFPDYTARPLETFVLLRNDGGWRFRPFALGDDDAASGRWLVLDSGDLDGDGDDDLALGAFFRGPPTIPIPGEFVRRWETNRVSVMILRNTSRR